MIFKLYVYTHHSNPVCAALATRSAAHTVQDLDTGVPLSEPPGSSLPVCMHHTVRPRSLPAICRPRSTHGTSVPSGALRPPLFLCCRPSSVERTADPSERVPIVPVIQGQTKNSPLPPSLQRPCVVLSHLCTFSTVLSCMHFNAVLLCYVILCPSTLVIRICIFLSYRITNLYLCCYFTNFIDN